MRGGFKELQGNIASLNKVVGDISEIKVFLPKLTKHPAHEEMSHSEGNEEGGGSHKGEHNEISEEIKYFQSRIDLPSFDGGDPFIWLGKANQYFELHDTLWAIV